MSGVRETTSTLLPGVDRAGPSSPPPGDGPVLLSVELSPAVALIFQLVRAAQPLLPADEIIARAIGHYAFALGVPALARDMDGDLADVPDFERRAPNRYRSQAPP